MYFKYLKKWVGSVLVMLVQCLWTTLDCIVCEIPNPIEQKDLPCADEVENKSWNGLVSFKKYLNCLSP